MSCAESDRIMQTLRVNAPGITDALLTLTLFNTIDEFLRRTNGWQYIQGIELTEDEFSYAVPVPAGTQVVRWLGVNHKDLPLAPSAAQAGATMSSVGTLLPELTFPDGDADFLPAATDVHPGTGVFSYSIYRPNYISLGTLPSADDASFPLVVALALTLDKSCLECDCGDWEVPDHMWDMYFQDWTDGVLGKLYAMPAKPWSAPTQAIYHNRRFRNHMAFRKQETLRGFVFGLPAWRFPRGWGG